jgi:uncharacterized protein
MNRVLLFRTAATLVLALLGALAWRALGLPLPWMIGPLLATAIVSMAGAPTHSAAPLRNTGQWLIGAALGLYFTPVVVGLVLQLWWAILMAIGWSLSVGWAFGLWLHRQLAGRLPGPSSACRATSYFAGAIGGASEMTLLAERAGARTDLVAAAHSLRMLIVTLGIPIAFQASGLQGLDPVVPATQAVRLPGLLMLLGTTGLAAYLLSRTRWPNPWFLGAFAVAIVSTGSGQEFSALPNGLTNAAQLFIGVSLGVRFRAEFMRTAPGWLGAVAVGTCAMILACALFAAAAAWMTGLHAATLVLGTAPGGIAEMAITAKVLALGVPVVAAFQVCRLVAVLVLVEPLYRYAVAPD